MAERLPQIARTDAAEQTPMTPREIVSELDRYIVGQRNAKRAVAIALRNRWRRQQVRRGSARRDRAEEHHHDRTDRRREDRDLAPPRQARAGAVPQGRGLEVHRGRLRRPRRRVDDPRPGRARHQHGARRRSGRRCGLRAREQAEERVLDLLLPPRAGRRIRAEGAAGSDRDDETQGDAREAAPHAARRQARRARSSSSRSAQVGESRWSRS